MHVRFSLDYFYVLTTLFSIDKIPIVTMLPPQFFDVAIHITL